MLELPLGEVIGLAGFTGEAVRGDDSFASELLLDVEDVA